MKTTLYYAVTSLGCGMLFSGVPERDEHFGVWKGTTCGYYAETLAYLTEHGLKLPPITFRDEPIAITWEVTV